MDNPIDIEAKPGNRRLIRNAKASIIIAVEVATLQLFVFSEQQTQISLDFLHGRSELRCAPNDTMRPKRKDMLQNLKSRPSSAAQ